MNQSRRLRWSVAASSSGSYSMKAITMSVLWMSMHSRWASTRLRQVIRLLLRLYVPTEVGGDSHNVFTRDMRVVARKPSTEAQR